VRVALTFDDGPDPDWTLAVLAALAAAGVTATFFVLGERVAAHPGVVRRTLAAGHAVELHGFRHLRQPELSVAEARADLDAGLAALATVGVAPGRWRLPWGQPASHSAALADAAGLALTGWTLDTHDWRGDGAAAMLAAIAPGLVDGAVVLAHDGLGPGARRTDAAETVALIGPLVAAARAAGLEPAALGAAWPVPPGNPELTSAHVNGGWEGRQA